MSTEIIPPFTLTIGTQEIRVDDWNTNKDGTNYGAFFIERGGTQERLKRQLISLYHRLPEFTRHCPRTKIKWFHLHHDDQGRLAVYVGF
jgi:hypothetical protein